MVATVHNLTSSSATSQYFRQDAGYYLRKGEDAADLRAKRAEHRNASTWHGSGRGCPGIASRQAGRGGRLREASSGPCDRDEDSARAPARRTARAPPGLRHHVFGPEVGVAGGASADEGAPERRPRRSFARTVRRCARRSTGSRRADATPAHPASARGVVPERSGAAAGRDGLRSGPDPGGWAAELRACGVFACDAGGVLDAPPRHPRLHRGQGWKHGAADSEGRRRCIRG